MQNQFKGFLDFIREQGVVGLAVGFMRGGAQCSNLPMFARMRQLLTQDQATVRFSLPRRASAPAQ